MNSNDLKDPNNFFLLKFVTLLVENFFLDKDEVVILEPGCGEGDLLIALQIRLKDDFPSISFKVFGFDVHQRSIFAPVGESITCINENDKWPYQDNFFDIVISNQVFEHVKDINFFFHELNRVMSEGAFSINLFPAQEMILEPHHNLPIVHWINDWFFRKSLIQFFTQIGLGKYKGAKKNGFDEGIEKWSALLSDYSTNYTHYMKTTDYLSLSKHYGFRATFKFTNVLFLYRVLLKLGVYKDINIKFDQKYSLIKNFLIFFVIKRFFGIAFFLNKSNSS